MMVAVDGSGGLQMSYFIKNKMHCMVFIDIDKYSPKLCLQSRYCDKLEKHAHKVNGTIYFHCIHQGEISVKEEAATIETAGYWGTKLSYITVDF